MSESIIITHDLINQYAHTLDEKYFTFYEYAQKCYNFAIVPLNEYIESIIGINNELNIVSVNSILSKLKNRKHMKKVTWMKKVSKLCEKSLYNEKHPFYTYSELYQLQNEQQIKQNLLDNAEQWSKNKKSLLMDFPYLTILQNSSIEKGFNDDLCINFYRFVLSILTKPLTTIEDKYYPAILIDKPIFAISQELLHARQLDSQSQPIYKVVTTENGIRLDIVKTDENSPDTIRCYSSFDSKVLGYIFMQAIMIPTNTLYTTNLVHLSKKELTNYLIRSNPSKKTDEQIERSINKFRSCTFIYEDCKKKSVFGIISSYDWPKEDSDGINIYLDWRITENIVRGNLISIAINDYQQLEDKVSSMICFALKKEQVLYQNCIDEEIEYTYSYFEGIIQLNKRYKTENMSVIKSALQEFVNKGIIIKNFHTIKDKIYITFLQLSSEEIQKLNSQNKLLDAE